MTLITMFLLSVCKWGGCFPQVPYAWMGLKIWVRMVFQSSFLDLKTMGSAFR